VFTSTNSTQASIKLEVAVKTFLIVTFVAVVTQIALLAGTHRAAVTTVLDRADAKLTRLFHRTVARVLAVTHRQLANTSHMINQLLTYLLTYFGHQ